MLPIRGGYQDVAALIARQPAVGESIRAHLIASPFGTIHAATFSFPQPVGTGIPAGPSLRVAAYAASNDITGALVRALPVGPQINVGTTFSDRTFPEINRAMKGPRLVPRVRPDFNSPLPSTIEVPPAGLQPVGHPAPAAGITEGTPFARAETVKANSVPEDTDLLSFDPSAEMPPFDSDSAPISTARFYFEAASLVAIEPWRPGQVAAIDPPEETAV